jgi:hypothetical protein
VPEETVPEDIETAKEFEQAWEEAVPVDDFPLPPPNGWLPKDFPNLTVDWVPYSTNSLPRADPFMTITPAGWLYIEVGNFRLAIPDVEEWEKFVHMVSCLWNSFALAQHHAATPAEGEGEPDERAVDEHLRARQAAVSGDDQSEPRGGTEAVLPPDAESG